MVALRHIGREIVLALSALALLFLAFAHQPVPVAYSSAYAVAASWESLSFCGGPPDDGGSEPHAPCHACRVSIADLPPAPCDAAPAFRRFDTFAFFQKDDLPRAGHSGSPYLSRAPPVAV